MVLSLCFRGQSHLILVHTSGLRLQVLPGWPQTDFWLLCTTSPLGQELAPVSQTATPFLHTSAPYCLYDFCKKINFLKLKYSWFTMLCQSAVQQSDSVTHTVQFSSVPQSCLTLRPHGLQHVMPPGPSPAPGVYSNSCPLSW